MKVGQKVKWFSKVYGIEKTGTIVEILKEGQRPVDYAHAHMPHHRLMFDDNAPVCQGENVVLVEVIVNNRKPAVYKLRV